MFKVGQKVICKVHGEGVVENVDEDGTYPVDVVFASGGWICYAADGKLYEDDDEPSLSVIEQGEVIFKVGQKVICKRYGEGVVTDIDEDGTYPVDVEFVGGEWDYYTEEGKLYEDDDEPSLSVIEE